MKKLIKIILVLSVTFSVGHLFADPNTPTELDQIIANDYRKMDSKRDKFRHPKQVLEFFQVKDDQSVVEILPGGAGWYTGILAPLVKEHGSFVAAQYNQNSSSEYFQRTIKKFNEKLAANPELFDKVKLGVFSAPDDIQLGVPNSVDRVLTFRNLHNWAGNDDNVLTIFKAFYKVLKVGGKFGLIDHRLPEDRTTPTAGYVKQSYAIKMAEAVGFTLEASSEINANPKDTADHPKGVWTLPPSFAMGDTDREKYTAIGESDRMTLLFVKK